MYLKKQKNEEERRAFRRQMMKTFTSKIQGERRKADRFETHFCLEAARLRD